MVIGLSAADQRNLNLGIGRAMSVICLPAGIVIRTMTYLASLALAGWSVGMKVGKSLVRRRAIMM